MFDGVSLEAALAMLEAAVPPPARRERVPLLQAAGRVAAESVAASRESPPFDRSPYDGYAVNHRDIAQASPDRPVALPAPRRTYAGDPRATLGAGEAGVVMTGAPIPSGATCVVPQEDVRHETGLAFFSAPVPENANICFRGEEVGRDQPLTRAGEVLSAGGIALLAGQGLDGASVFPKVRAAVLSTGSELTPPGAPLADGGIYDSNSFLLAALLTEWNATVTSTRVEADDPVRLAEAAAASLETSDFLVATGGVSVGERDHMPKTAGPLGADVLFHGVDIRPGAPALAMIRRGKPILCLSGNPYAAFVTAALLAAPVLRRMAGLSAWRPRRTAATLTETYPKGGNARRFVPAWIEGRDAGFPAGDPGRRTPLSLARCNCLLDIPAGRGPVAAGSHVEAVLL